jgi:hypothetical protein
MMLTRPRGLVRGTRAFSGTAAVRGSFRLTGKCALRCRAVAFPSQRLDPGARTRARGCAAMTGTRFRELPPCFPPRRCGRLSFGGSLQLHPGAAGFGEPDRDCLFGAAGAVLASPDVVDCFADIFARLTRRCLALPPGTTRSFKDGFLGHDIFRVESPGGNHAGGAVRISRKAAPESTVRLCNNLFPSYACNYIGEYPDRRRLRRDCRSARADRLIARLSDGGKVLMPLSNYGFSKRFAWGSDRYGVS